MDLAVSTLFAGAYVRQCAPNCNPLVGCGLAVALGVLVLGAGCSAKTTPHAGVTRAEAAAAARDLVLTPARGHMMHLAWTAPAKDCPQRYVVTTQQDPAQHEPQTFATLWLTQRQRRTVTHEQTSTPLQARYLGFRAERQPLVRQAELSESMLGPASPIAACMPKTWDPIEDAALLGWPVLPNSTLAVGQSWNGHAMGGTCNQTPCVDPETGKGGPENHQRSCVSMPLRQTLAALYTIGDTSVALVTGMWSDGHKEAGAAPGVWSEQAVLIAHGRPLWAQVMVHHGFAGTTRTWTMHSADACAGSIVALGGTIDPAWQDRAHVEREGDAP